MRPLALFLFVACLPAVWQMEQKALDEFVNLLDPHYSYTVLEKKTFNFLYDFTVITINMTSQKWLDESEVDKPVWSHNLTIYVPKTRKVEKSCLLFIRPDKKDESTSPDPFHFKDFGALVLSTKSVVAELRPVPDQPLTFYNHPLGHKNSRGYDIMAYSWWRFLNDMTAPPHWLVQFPMVKATIRAIDTITAYVKEEYYRDITKFTLAGISMAGWASWLTAAVDKRVEAIIPIAMDLLNINENLHHQYRAYCGWSYMLRSFYEMNITQELDSPRFSLLASHVDPLAYNERYTNVAKYIIDLSGDEIFQPDNSHYYFSQLEGKKYLRILPNYDQSFSGNDTFMRNISPFYVRMVQKKYPLPNISWNTSTTNTGGIITLRTYNVHRVYAWYADTVGGTRRDFRTKIAAGSSTQNNPVKWTKTSPLKGVKDVYKAEFQNPAKGWRAFFIEAVYTGGVVKAPFTATSELLIIPDTFPCPDCDGDGCRGTLV
ncbi:autocrine proliferation repressor protein A-like [Eublepharis macularius]|uniref:Autocrine proliferation repressor protein A-like n=1 Tax=Eublepharis macularius TaxID=481883 RepID=A0AA97J3C3_EUBMA|nr:autocrine proliferation repressor protein A-like [Eublepharis macularius]